MIVVDADGVIITAANGHVSSDNPELVKLVKKNALIGTYVRLVEPHGKEIQASLDPQNLIGITAALFSARPGRTKLLEAPIEVLEWLREDTDSGSEQDFSSEPKSLEEAEAEFRAAGERSVRLLLELDTIEQETEK